LLLFGKETGSGIAYGRGAKSLDFSGTTGNFSLIIVAYFDTITYDIV
jgi:hypothetical protein